GRVAGPVHDDGAWARRRGVADVAEEVAEGLNAVCRGVSRAGAAVSVQDDDGGFASLESRLLRGRGGLLAMTWCAGRRRRFAQMVGERVAEQRHPDAGEGDELDRGDEADGDGGAAPGSDEVVCVL